MDKNVVVINITIIIEIITALVIHITNGHIWGSPSGHPRQGLLSIPSLLSSFPPHVSRFLFLMFMAGILPKDKRFDMVFSL